MATPACSGSRDHILFRLFDSIFIMFVGSPSGQLEGATLQIVNDVYFVGKNRLKLKLFLIQLLGIFPSVLYADSMVELGAHFGGDELIVSSYGDGRRDSLKAGERFSFGLGRLYQHGDGWETQIMFGVKSDARFDNELEVSWVRYPLNGFVFYRMQTVRMGLGATVHFSPKLKGTGVADGITEEFEHAVGGILELDIIRSERFLWGIRLTFIEYESKQNGRVLDGNSIGFLMIGQL